MFCILETVNLLFPAPVYLCTVIVPSITFTLGHSLEQSLDEDHLLLQKYKIMANLFFVGMLLMSFLSPPPLYLYYIVAMISPSFFFWGFLPSFLLRVLSPHFS